MIKLACPCCGYQTFEYSESLLAEGDSSKTPAKYLKYARGFSYDCCKICYWEDDSRIVNNEFFETGCQLPLSESQDNYKKYGAMRKDLVSKVRKPTKDDVYVGPLKGLKDYD